MATNRNGRPPARKGQGGSYNRQPDDGYYYQVPSGSRSSSRNFEDISSYSSPKAKKRAAQQAPNHRGRKKQNSVRKASPAKVVVSILCVLLVLFGIGYFYVSFYLLNGLTTKSISKDKDSLGISASAMTESGIKNIALFGLDSRDDTNEGRSDALMILTVDNKHGKLKLTSILRDSEVYIEDYGQDKVTHAYAYGGPELAIKTLNQNFQLDIEDYVTVNFVQMAKIVDAFGGTRVNVSAEEVSYINENLWTLAQEDEAANIVHDDFLKEDEYGDNMLLNGNQAVAYARIRYLDLDDVRASRQQNVLRGLLTQLKSLGILQYPGVVHSVAPMCETSLDVGDVLGMAPILFTDMELETLSIPGEAENPQDGYTDAGNWVYVYDLEAASQHIRSFIYETD